MYGIEEFISQNLDCEDTELPYTMMFFSLNNCDDCIKPEIEWSIFKTAAPSQDWSSRVCLADYTSDGSRLPQPLVQQIAAVKSKHFKAPGIYLR